MRQSNFRPTSGQCLGGARTLERRGSPRHGAGFFSIPLIRRKETVLALPSRRGGEVKPGEPGGWRRFAEHWNIARSPTFSRTAIGAVRRTSCLVGRSPFLSLP